jgi:hypothetical protein
MQKYKILEKYQRIFVIAFYAVIIFFFNPSLVFCDTISATTTLIASGSFPAANSLTITNIPLDFDYLTLRYNGVSSNTATRYMNLQISINNGSTYLTSGYRWVEMNLADSGNDALWASVEAVSAATSIDGVVTIRAYNGGAVNATGFSFTSGTNNWIATGFSTTTRTVNALRLIWNGSGNFDGGTYALYGTGATTTSLTVPSSGSSSTTTSNYAPTQQEFLFLFAVVLFIGSIPFWERALGNVLKNEV